MKHYFEHRRKLLNAAVAVMFVTMSAVTATAQEATSNTSLIKAYLKSDTTVVGWVDLSQVDVDAVTEFAGKMNIAINDMTTAKAVQEALVQMGVKRMYWLGNLERLVETPKAMIIPLKSDKIEPVASMLKALIEETGLAADIEIDGDCVLVGDKDEIVFLKSSSGEPDAEFLTTVNTINQPHGVVLKTPVAALVPVMSVLPQIFGTEDPRVAKATELLINVKSLTLSGLLPPSKFELQIATRSAESASGIAKLINDWTTESLSESATAIQMKASDSNVLLTSSSMETTSSMFEALQQLTSPARNRGQRLSTLNSLKQIGLAMHNFHDAYGHFPPQSLASKDGKRLLSWRVLILPFLEHTALYQEFHLDEAWDSPHNIKLVAKMPFAYRGSQTDPEVIAAGKTRMVAPLTKDSIFGRPGGGISFRSIKDGTSNTLLVVEAAPDQAVIWTKPEDVEMPQENLLSVLLDAAADGFHALIADGSARLFPQTVDDETLKAVLSIDGKEVISFDKL